MKNFMDDNFLLDNDTAVVLYHKYAKDMPIIDYHCHLSPQEIYENKKFKNLTEIWLYGDHYKWRGMRVNGIGEEYITGDAGDYEKFLAWAKTVPMLIGNPLYNWTHLELQRFFGIYDILNEETSPAIWEKVNTMLQGEGYRPRDFIQKSKVKVVCTTDDPTDTLEYHEKLKNENLSFKVLPGFRPDKGLEINADGYGDWVKKLAAVSEINIENYEDFLKALESRVDFFHSLGGRVSDHALNTVVYEETNEKEVVDIFAKALIGEKVTDTEERKYKTYTLKALGKMYADRGWVMQYHMNTLRNTNTKMYERLGPDTGYDSMNDAQLAKPLVSLLDMLERENALPKTILYSLNPKDYEAIATIIGSFQGGGVPGKMQFGTAWWFNDTKTGMLDQMQTLANIGVLSRFIGMLTDSRSFLSYPRHEYFRRIACSLIGSWAENGEIPADEKFLGIIVQNIAFYNAKEYFDFGL